METSGLEVELAPASQAGALYPRYLNRPKVVIVESRAWEAFAHAVTVRGPRHEVTLEANEDRILVNFEVVRPRFWTRQPLRAHPTPHRKASLRLSMRTIERRYLDLPGLQLVTAPGTPYLEVVFGDPSPRAVWVALSQKCMALVDVGRLVSIVVDTHGMFGA